jgi:mono/diheme cytochrome c family protein
MEPETVFYIAGLSLMALALVVSFIGLRVEKFPPSKGVLAGVIALFVVLVGASMTFAFKGAEEEQDHRNEQIAAGELPSPAQVMEEMGAQAQEAEDAAEGDDAPAQASEDETASTDGKELFSSVGCGGCHTLEAAGSTGTIGPDLGVELKGEDVAFIRESIITPDKEVEDGFPGGTMPDDYEQQLTPEELDAIVAFIADAVGAKQ